MDAASSTAPDEHPDVRAIVADIEREARARRRLGAVDPSYERQLDALFEAIAPVGATGQSVQAVLEQTERTARLDVPPPIASNLPGGQVVKRGVERIAGWRFEHMRGQVQSFAFSIVHAVRMLNDRVVALERRLPSSRAELRRPLPLGSDFDVTPWLGAVCAWCAGCPGRVLHAECGSGALVVAMHEAGIDAFGADPRDDAAEIADRAGVEVRTVDVLEYLGSVPAGALGGVVLTGCADRFVLGDQLDLAAMAARTLAPGGRVVVLGTHPAVWERQRDPIQADLSFGRPLHPETWAHVLGEAGLHVIEQQDGRPSEPLHAGPDVTPELATALGRIEAALFPPTSYAVVAEQLASAPPIIA